jgi:hypothetical protein
VHLVSVSSYVSERIRTLEITLPEEFLRLLGATLFTVPLLDTISLNVSA